MIQSTKNGKNERNKKENPIRKKTIPKRREKITVKNKEKWREPKDTLTLLRIVENIGNYSSFFACSYCF